MPENALEQMGITGPIAPNKQILPKKEESNEVRGELLASSKEEDRLKKQVQEDMEKLWLKNKENQELAKLGLAKKYEGALAEIKKSKILNFDLEKLTPDQISRLAVEKKDQIAGELSKLGDEPEKKLWEMQMQNMDFDLKILRGEQEKKQTIDLFKKYLLANNMEPEDKTENERFSDQIDAMQKQNNELEQTRNKLEKDCEHFKNYQDQLKKIEDFIAATNELANAKKTIEQNREFSKEFLIAVFTKPDLVHSLDEEEKKELKKEMESLIQKYHSEVKHGVKFLQTEQEKNKAKKLTEQEQQELQKALREVRAKNETLKKLDALLKDSEKEASKTKKEKTLRLLDNFLGAEEKISRHKENLKGTISDLVDLAKTDLDAEARKKAVEDISSGKIEDALKFLNVAEKSREEFGALAHQAHRIATDSLPGFEQAEDTTWKESISLMRELLSLSLDNLEAFKNKQRFLDKAKEYLGKIGYIDYQTDDGKNKWKSLLSDLKKFFTALPSNIFAKSQIKLDYYKAGQSEIENNIGLVNLELAQKMQELNTQIEKFRLDKANEEITGMVLPEITIEKTKPGTNFDPEVFLPENFPQKDLSEQAIGESPSKTPPEIPGEEISEKPQAADNEAKNKLEAQAGAGAIEVQIKNAKRDQLIKAENELLEYFNVHKDNIPSHVAQELLDQYEKTKTDIGEIDRFELKKHTEQVEDVLDKLREKASAISQPEPVVVAEAPENKLQPEQVIPEEKDQVGQKIELNQSPISDTNKPSEEEVKTEELPFLPHSLKEEINFTPEDINYMKKALDKETFEDVQQLSPRELRGKIFDEAIIAKLEKAKRLERMNENIYDQFAKVGLTDENLAFLRKKYQNVKDEFGNPLTGILSIMEKALKDLSDQRKVKILEIALGKELFGKLKNLRLLRLAGK